MLPKLHLLTAKDDGLRPALACVRITKKDLRACSGFIGAIIQTESTGLKIEQLPESPVYMKAESFKLLTTPDVVAIIFEGEFFRVLLRNKPYKLAPIYELDENYPDLDAVFPTGDQAKDTGEVGINPTLLSLLAEGLTLPSEKNKSLKLKFCGTNRAILVKTFASELDAKGIILPVAIES